MMNKPLNFLGIILGLCVAMFFYIKKGSDVSEFFDQDREEMSAPPLIQNQTDSLSEDGLVKKQNEPYSERVKPSHSKSISLHVEDYADNPSLRIESIRACDKSLEAFDDKVSMMSNSMAINFSDTQHSVLEDLRRNCEAWYEYLRDLTEEESLLNEEEAKEVKAQASLFGGAVTFDKTTIAQARAFIAENDKTDVGFMALMYLLDKDAQFKLAIANKLGTKNFQFLKSNRFYIAELYHCRVNPDYCAPNALTMVGRCLQDESYCGMNYRSFIAGEYTAQQFFDLERSVDIILQLASNEGFEETSYPDPGP